MKLFFHIPGLIRCSIFSFVFLFFYHIPVHAQEQTEPAYKRFPTVPPFEILAPDSLTKITKANLKKNHPVMLMYFSPDCEHCQHQTEDILSLIDKLKEVQIVMVSYQPLESIRSFREKYKLNRYSNIILGRDFNFFLPSFYGFNSLPFLALYDQKGALIKVHESNMKPAAILSSFKK